MAYLLQHLLSESARDHPGKKAVRIGDLALTYAQLDALTNQLARTLIQAGVKRGDRVAGMFVFLDVDPNIMNG